MKFLKLALQTTGAVSLLAVLGMGCWILYGNSRDKINKSSRKDALFILNWGGLPTNQDFRILSSYESSRTFTGDHLDYYCIVLPKFEISVQTKDQWHDGPESDPLLVSALETAINDAHEAGGGCIPSIQEANSPAMKMLFPSVVLSNRYALAGDIILYDSKRRMLYYVGYKT